MESAEEIVLPLRQIVPFMICAVAGLTVIFILMAVVRLWGLRVQSKGGASGGLDLEDLRRQREAGEISEEEYEAVCATLTGSGGGRGAADAATHAEPAPETPINREAADDSGDGSERSRSDEQG